MNEVRHAQYVMGTVVEIAAQGNETVREAVYCAMREFERLERMFSRFDPSSELSYVNREAAVSRARVSKEFFDVASRGLDYSARSQGCFSISMGALNELWERCVLEERLPEPVEIEAARELAKHERIRIDANELSVHFAAEGVALDFGGLVKGYAVDRAAEALQQGGVDRATINAGTSSIRVISAPGDEPSEFGIRHPLREESTAGILSIMNQALSTSGTYEHQFVIAGRTFSHLLDPKSGIPFELMGSATAVCESAMLAEAASKILLFAGCERGMEIFDANGWEIEGVTMISNDGATLEVTHNKSLPIRLAVDD